MILAKALQNNGVLAKVFDMKQDYYPDKGYAFVFGYGCSHVTQNGKRINTPKAISNCVKKTNTFDLLTKSNINTVPYVTQKHQIPKEWEWVVVRDKIDGRKAEGIGYYENIPGNVPNGALFTEYFEHQYEYRIMVFMGEVVGRYYKRTNKDDWYFNVQPKKRFELIDQHCIRAAKVLGIDYVGFDVVAKNKQDFRILEANSGPVITDEAEDAIVSYFINL